MAELGAISSYALAVQQMQMSLIKNSVDMQRQMIDTLLGSRNERSVPVSSTSGQNVDISI